MSNGVDFRTLALDLRGQLTAAQSELAALREELAAFKSPGPLCFCGLKQTKNPHPEAGVPPGYLEVGTVYDCIPCLNKSRRAWSKKANKLQGELTAAEQRNAAFVELLERMLKDDDMPVHWFAHSIDATLKPTEPGASDEN